MKQEYMQSKSAGIFAAIFFLSFFLSGCASRPPATTLIKKPDTIPQSSTALTEIKATNPDELELVFELVTENRDTEPYRLTRLEAVLQLQGMAPVTQVMEPSLLLAAGSTATQKLSFPLNLSDHPDHTSNNLRYDLILRLVFLDTGGAELTTSISLTGDFVRVLKPLLRISSIKIHREELINTSMNVSLEIENPNDFPLDLSELTYEIFGEGRYWAEGMQKASFQIPAYTKSNVVLQITMNFIDMKRDLLDQFIKMQDVGYRFQGNVRVLTGISYLNEFIMDFDEQGRTPVAE